MILTGDPRPNAPIWRDRDYEVDGEPHYTVLVCGTPHLDTTLRSLPVVLGWFLRECVPFKGCVSAPGDCTESGISYLSVLADRISVLGEGCKSSACLSLLDALHDHLDEFQVAFSLGLPQSRFTEALYLRRIFFKCMSILDRIYPTCSDLLPGDPVEEQLSYLRTKTGAQAWEAYAKSFLHLWIYGVSDENYL